MIQPEVKTKDMNSSESGSADCSSWSSNLPVEAMNHLVQGKRHMLVQDYSSAVSSLQEACELYVKFYGETASECGEVYLHYGKALLELARLETGILGNALQETSEDENKGSDEEKNKGSDEEQEGSDDNATDEDEEEAEPDDDDDDEEQEEQTDNAQETSTAESSTIEDKAGPSGLQAESVEKEEEISNLQLAWEVLELAKIIFSREAKINSEAHLKVAEILSKLAEISMESENYRAAIEDLNECLQIRQQYLKSDDRLLAETYYQMGLAYSFDNQFDAAIDSFRRTVDVIKLRISNLKSKVDTVSKSGFYEDDPAKEVEELEALLPDMCAKIEDTEDLMQNTKESLAEVAFQKLEEVSCSTSSAKPVSNISHLLKRKKPEDQGNSRIPEVKKLKSDAPNVVNGDIEQNLKTQSAAQGTRCETT